MLIFPLIASGVSFVFSLFVLHQCAPRRKPSQLVWSIALLMFSLAALAETLATPFGFNAPSHWSEFLVKIYYIFGATLVVGYLALGTLYLQEERSGAYLLVISLVLTFSGWFPAIGLEMIKEGNLFGVFTVSAIYLLLIIVFLAVGKQTANIYLAVLLVSTAAAVLLIALGEIDPSKLSQTAGWQALDRTFAMRSFAFSLNVLGTFVLVLGALHSAWIAWRKKHMKERALANILIAAGVFIVAGGGAIGGYFGLGGQAAISVPMAVGITVMFLGFLQAGRPTPKKA